MLGSSVTLPENAEAALGIAVLAASAGRPVAEAADAMVRVREVIDPRPGSTAVFSSHIRGWLPEPMAQHARRRAAR